MDSKEDKIHFTCKKFYNHFNMIDTLAYQYFHERFSIETMKYSTDFNYYRKYGNILNKI